jgi:hypothetical protein
MGDEGKTQNERIGFRFDQRILDGAVVTVVILESDAQEKHLPVF